VKKEKKTRCEAKLTTPFN